MSTTADKWQSPPQLPPDLWIKVLRIYEREEGIISLWTQCRSVCNVFKKEVESIFQQGHLERTTIWFPLDADTENVYILESSVNPLPPHFLFDRLSEDGTLSIFKSDASFREHSKAEENASFRQYIDDIRSEDNVVAPRHYVQLGSHINDIPIPSLSMDDDFVELSCDWRTMISSLFYEEKATDDSIHDWNLHSGGLKEEIARQSRGGLDMETVFKMAMNAFKSQSDSAIKDARRRRIDHQLKISPLVRGQIQPWSGVKELSALKRLDFLRSQAEELDYDAEETDTEEGDSGEDEDDEWENEEDEDEDEDEIHGHDHNEDDED